MKEGQGEQRKSDCTCTKVDLALNILQEKNPC